ncbi:hypothetical protein CRYUN_Cryun11dG0086000 [Craigia yunnanensis]
MKRVSPLFLVLLVLGFFFATYNLLTMIIHYKTSSSENWDLSDPIIRMPENLKEGGDSNSKYHVALTATDAPYSQWQCRIMYYWYKKVKDMPGSDMGDFTRILHSGKSDNLMEEIPTVVVDPLPEGLDRGYIVLNRPWAFVQWLEKATIDEEYILMAEPDHVFVNPLPNLAHGKHPAGFPFFYIKPAEHELIIRKYYPKEKGPVTDIDPIGNSPVIIRKSVLEEISPTWMNISLRMKDDPATDKAFGWVLEMYAYAVASALHGVRHILRKDFMLQPPWDLEVRKKFIIHYTYGCDYNLKVQPHKDHSVSNLLFLKYTLYAVIYLPFEDEILPFWPYFVPQVLLSELALQGESTYGKIGEWRFDKRSYLSGPPPRNLSLPPPGVPESVVRLVKMVNEATANIPNWDTLNHG